VISVLDKSSEFRERLEHQLKEWTLPKSLVDDVANHLTLLRPLLRGRLGGKEIHFLDKDVSRQSFIELLD
jgi:hypothetical protein